MRSSNHALGHPTARLLLASLAAALSMGVSHQALAACSNSGTAGIVLDCSGDDAAITSAVAAAPASSIATANPIAGVRITEDATLEVGADVSSRISAALLSATNNNYGVYGIWGQVAGDPPTPPTSAEVFTVNVLAGTTVSASHAGRGLAAGIYAQGDVEQFTVNNFGTISVERGPQTINSINAAGAVTVDPNGDPALRGTLGIAAGIYNNEEEVENEIISNFGTIRATGQLTAGIYSRANALLIENYGTIEATPGSGIVNAAIATYDGRIQGNGPEGEDPPTHRVVTYGKSFIDNYGTVQGDIQVIEQTNLAFMGSLLAGTDLALSAQTNRRDSEIFNAATINGNIWLGAGNHVFTNTGTVTGNLVVDQRREITPPTNPGTLPFAIGVSQRPTAGDDDDDDDDDVDPSNTFSSYADFVAVVPDHHFEFDNAGVFNGNVTVFTNLAGTASSIELRPHITGSGTGSTTADPSENSGFINGTLAIGTGLWPTVTASTIATTTTLTPVIDSTVRDGESFLVAKHLTGTDLPTLIEDSYLVDWEAYQVGGSASGNALAIRASVKNAFDIEGISNPAAATLNGLIAAGSDDSDVLGALGGAVQSLSDEDDVRTAGSQLAPETNFATQQAAITLNSAIGQHIDTRLASVGGTGSSPGYVPGPSGLGIKQSDPNRSNLGGLKDGDDDFVAPRSGALWGQAFGVGMNQGERSLVDGYDARLYGILTGYDNWIAPGVRIGVAGGYANTRIYGEGDTSRNSTDIDSYLVQAYGAIKNPGWYVSGRTGFTWHDYDTRRVLTVPFEDSAEASHDGRQFNASIELGAPMHFASAIVTPIGSLTYSNLHQDGYTEDSDGGMALRINSQSNDSLVSALGIKALIPIAADTVIEGRAAWLHEFSDTAQVVTAAFAAGGGTFTAAGPDVGRDTAALGAGILAQFNPGSTFELNYDANIREDYLAHIGSARVKLDF